MGIIFQDFRLIPSMTVYENVAFAMHVLNVPHKEIRPRVEYILELVHLEDKPSATRIPFPRRAAACGCGACAGA